MLLVKVWDRRNRKYGNILQCTIIYFLRTMGMPPTRGLEHMWDLWIWRKEVHILGNHFGKRHRAIYKVMLSTTESCNLLHIQIICNRFRNSGIGRIIVCFEEGTLEYLAVRGMENLEENKFLPEFGHVISSIVVRAHIIWVHGAFWGITWCRMWKQILCSKLLPKGWKLKGRIDFLEVP